jgi:hypothetical protein
VETSVETPNETVVGVSEVKQESSPGTKVLDERELRLHGFARRVADIGVEVEQASTIDTAAFNAYSTG